MFQILRHGIDISRHHVKGVYVCMIGKNRKQSPNSMAEVICTLREGPQEVAPDGENSAETRAKYGPITLAHQGTHVTLRPWDPHACVIAAAIRNRLIHFPIRPGSGVLALGCTLQTLSHIADIIGPEGRLIGVIDKTQGQRPSPEELRKFFKAHPGVLVVTEDVQSASLERYERLLSLPLASKHAFLMALHPRLGAESEARRLLEDEAPQQIVRRIFSFLEGGEAPDVRSLVVCHWPPGTRVDVVRAVVLSHIDILQRWRASRKADEHEKRAADSDSDAGEDTTEKDTEEKTTSATDTHAEPSCKKRSKEEQEFVPQWVFLDLPTDNIVINNPNANVNNKLIEVVDDMKRLTSGLRTGLLAKEQLLLAPYFPNHALLLLKYVAHRDECSKKVTKKKFPSPPGLGAGPDGQASDDQPPPTGAVPVPCFAPKFKGPGDGLSALAAPGALAAGSMGSPATSSTAARSPSTSSALVSAVAGPSSHKARRAHDRPLTWLDAQSHEQQPPPHQELRVGLVGSGDGTGSDYGGLGGLGGCGGGQMLAAVQGLGGQGVMVPRGKGQGLDGSRGGTPGVPGRHPVLHANLPGPVTPGPLDHFGVTGLVGGMDLPGGCMMGGADRNQLWAQLGAAGHMAPPGLWGEGYPPEPPMPVGPGTRGWRPPNYVHYGKGGGGGSGPGGALGKGPGGGMMGAWRGGPGSGQAGGGAPGQGNALPPHLDPTLQYAMMSF